MQLSRPRKPPGTGEAVYLAEYQLVDSCTGTNSFEVRLGKRKIDLARAGAALSCIGEEAAKTPVVLLFKVGGRAVSVYASGRMLIKGADRKAAEKMAGQLVSALENGGAIV